MSHRDDIQSYLFEVPGNLGKALEVALDDPMDRTSFGKQFLDIQFVLEGLISYHPH